MDKDQVIKYSPVVVVIISVLLQWNLFVTPKEANNLKDEILEKVSNTYVTKIEYNGQKEDVKDMKMKLDKIYDFIILGKK